MKKPRPTVLCKNTYGVVTQTWRDGIYQGAEFTESDQPVDFEDAEERIVDGPEPKYEPITLVQPEDIVELGVVLMHAKTILSRQDSILARQICEEP